MYRGSNRNRIVPIMVLSFIISLSIQGLGIPETVLIFLLIQFNVNEEIAAAAGLFHLIIFIIQILIGVVLYLTDKDYTISSVKEHIQFVFGEKN